MFHFKTMTAGVNSKTESRTGHRRSAKEITLIQKTQKTHQLLITKHQRTTMQKKVLNIQQKKRQQKICKTLPRRHAEAFSRNQNPSSIISSYLPAVPISSFAKKFHTTESSSPNVRSTESSFRCVETHYSRFLRLELLVRDVYDRPRFFRFLYV